MAHRRGDASSNLFVVSLDERGEWYRYHILFSELLLYELRSDRPDLVPRLRRRASAYVAPNTVRTQIKSIYRKLGVPSRKQAVDKAHAMGLI